MKKQNNNMQNNEDLLSFIDADNRKSNVLLTVKDGKLYDSQGNNYTQSYLDEEHIPIILGKAPRNSSSYFDRFGAINFFNAAAAPIANFTPSNIVGSIRKAHDYTSFIDSFMNQNNNGFFTDEYAREHPYITFGSNIIGDALATGLGYKTGQIAYRLRPSNIRKHIFENISPISYEQPITRLKTAIKSALSGQKADIDNPNWFNKKNADLLKDYGDNTDYYLQARFDAWRKYLGLPQKYNTFTPSKTHKGTFTDIKGINQLKNIPNQVTGESQLDFVNSVGGSVGVPKITILPEKGYKNTTYGVTTTTDVFDLHPFSRINDTIFDRYFKPTYNKTIGKQINKINQTLRHKGEKYAYDNAAINDVLKNGDEMTFEMFDPRNFPNNNKIKRIIGEKIINIANKLNNYSYLFYNTGIGKPLNKLSNRLGKIEASTFLPGAKPFTTTYDIPWTKDYKTLKLRTYKGFNRDNDLPQSVKQFMIDNPNLDYDVKLRNGGYLNNNWTMQDEAGYRYWRSRLPKNLRDTDDNIYDMRAAYKAGMQPKWDENDKLYHLDSRDPQSGRILKSPHHPTYLKALIEDGTMGYYPTMDEKGNTYTETWKGNNMFADGGYIPSDSIKKRIANWEGASMKTNRSFEAEARDFNSYLPKGATNKLSQQQLDALYSYSYNVGAGNFNKRVVPVLNNYLNGNATREDVQRSMYATRDNELRGLTTRRNAEREMFGGNYRTAFTGTGNPNYFGYIDRNQQYRNMVENQNKNKFQLPYNEQSNTYKNPFDEPNLNVSLQDISNNVDNNVQQQYSQLPISKLNVASVLLQANSPVNNANNVQPNYSYAQSLLNDFDNDLNNNRYSLYE